MFATFPKFDSRIPNVSYFLHFSSLRMFALIFFLHIVNVHENSCRSGITSFIEQAHSTIGQNNNFAGIFRF